MLASEYEGGLCQGRKRRRQHRRRESRARHRSRRRRHCFHAPLARLLSILHWSSWSKADPSRSLNRESTISEWASLMRKQNMENRGAGLAKSGDEEGQEGEEGQEFVGANCTRLSLLLLAGRNSGYITLVCWEQARCICCRCSDRICALSFVFHLFSDIFIVWVHSI